MTRTRHQGWDDKDVLARMGCQGRAGKDGRRLTHRQGQDLGGRAAEVRAPPRTGRQGHCQGQDNKGVAEDGTTRVRPRMVRQTTMVLPRTERQGCHQGRDDKGEAKDGTTMAPPRKGRQGCHQGRGIKDETTRAMWRAPRQR